MLPCRSDYFVRTADLFSWYAASYAPVAALNGGKHDNIAHSGRPEQAREIAFMVGELLAEIMDAIGRPAFRFDMADAQARLHTYLSDGTYQVIVAIDETSDTQAVGFISAYESHALYAGGAFGTIPEFYVRPEYRHRGTGKRLIEALKASAIQRGWKRLEVATPPLPEFQATLAFYERKEFSVTGGRKLQQEL